VWTRVIASARLHFGLFNLSGIDGKVDGGAGVALNDPNCVITICDRSAGLELSASVSPAMTRAITEAVGTFTTKFGLQNFNIRVDQNIPEHIGLGSKTACLMALGRALSEHFLLELDCVDLATLVRRGGTSGVGVHASQFGGIVVDEGHDYPEEKNSFVPSSASGAFPPPLRERHAAPDGCAVIYLSLDAQGLNGIAEKIFFQQSCPIPESETLALLNMVENILLPGLRAQFLPQINEGLQAFQSMGMKAREWQIQGPMTTTLREKWEKRRGQPGGRELPPMCLSSMGPTVFMLTYEPRSVVDQLVRFGVEQHRIVTAKPSLSGHTVERGC
jgi:beta-ribofuranosylaminobenzene 5'-phosphate synthase